MSIRVCLRVRRRLIGSRSVFRFTDDQFSRWTWGPFIIARSARWSFLTVGRWLFIEKV